MKAQAFIKRFWNVDSENEEFDYFMNYTKTVSNISASEFSALGQYANDRRLDAVDMFFIARDVHPDVDFVVSSYDPDFNPYEVEVMTEMGICYSVNSIFGGKLGHKVSEIEMYVNPY